MKKYLLLTLTLLLCASLFSCAFNFNEELVFGDPEVPTADINKPTEEVTQTPTEEPTEKPTEKPTETTTIDDISLLDQIEIGMERKDVRKMLKVPYQELRTDIADRYFLSDGRPVYIRYHYHYKDKKLDKVTVYQVQVDELVDPEVASTISVGMTFGEVAELLNARGVSVGSGFIIYEYLLTDGRKLNIWYSQENATSDINTLTVGRTKIISDDDPPAYTSTSLDTFIGHVCTTNKGEEAYVTVPKLVSNKIEFTQAYDLEGYYMYYFTIKGLKYQSGVAYDCFSVNIYKEDGSYERRVNSFQTVEKDGYAYHQSSIQEIFFLNNNGKAITISVPGKFIREGQYLETLDELKKYIDVENINLPSN